MRRRVGGILIAGMFILVARPVWAAVDLGKWFTRAAAYEAQGDVKGTALAKPDFLPGTSYESVCHVASLKAAANPVIFDNFWELKRYDRKHHIALAAATTDQCSSALFEASPPGIDVPDQDHTPRAAV